MEPNELQTLLDVVRRHAAAPWGDAPKIPWHEQSFSERMLSEHLSQDHDRASRRFELIDTDVDWIHEHVLGSQPQRILDLGCGPGLYTSRLAQRGHTCVGIDYSPASVAYAKDEARRMALSCEYVLGDMRQVDYGTGYGLVMMIHGEFNSFQPSDAKMVLAKTDLALAESGVLLLEVHTPEAVQLMGKRPPLWHTAEHGLFSDQPYLVLQERAWDTASRASTTRHFVVDAATGEVTTLAETLQAYRDDEFSALLRECGFEETERIPSLSGMADDSRSDLFVALAHRRAPTP